MLSKNPILVACGQRRFCGAHGAFHAAARRDNSREDFQNEDERRTAGVGRREERTLDGSWPVEIVDGGQKTASTVGKLRFFRGLAEAHLARAGSINLCGNFRQEPNAERSGYYISSRGSQ